MKQSKFMKNLLVLFSIILLLACGQSGYKNSLQEEGLSGKVKSIRNIAFTFAEENGQIVILDTLATDNFFVTFDEKGNEVERIFFASDGQPVNVYRSEYDESGRRIMQTGADMEGNVLETLTFVYNNKGQRTEQLLTDSFQSTKTTFQYDRKGNLTEIAAATHIGKPLYLVTLTYEKNQVIGERVAVYDWGSANETTYKNDKQGREIEAVTRFFNSAGVLTAQETRTTVYEDDKHGNWVRKKTFVDGMPATLYKRTIEYF